MRIPSQFNQGNLYRRDNRHRGPDDSYRRLFRLILGLALVLVVMRQASKPSMYRVFFDPSLVASTTALQNGGQGANGIESANSNLTNLDAITDPAVGTPSISTPPTAEDRRIAREMVAELRPSDQRQWWIALSRWHSGRAVPLVPSSIESALLRLDSLAGVDEETRSAWREMLRALESLIPANVVGNGQPSRTASSQVEASGGEASGGEAFGADSQRPETQFLPQIVAMLGALDQAANARVVDGSVWRAGDFDSLYRFLDQSANPPRSGVIGTSVIPLLQQPDVFRNQWVRIHGGVARVQRVEAEENPFGIEHYWQLWLRPTDGADRPMVAIVSAIPESVASVGAEVTKLEGPEISVVGRYLKRLAYESGVGADLAPVVVGTITSAPMSEAEIAQATGKGESEAKEGTWWPILLACLIGLGSAALVMWRTAVAAKRARTMRQSHRLGPDTFLQELGSPENGSSLSDEDSE